MLRLPRFLLPLLALAPALFAEAPKKVEQLAFLQTAEQAESVTGLQTLSAEYRPASGTGPSIWLIGVAHLGTPEYFAALQKRLDAQSAVLFEGVGAEHLQQGAKPDTSEGLQGKLARAIGLVFQLDAIDYKRAHFVNTDMTPEALNQAIEKRATATADAAKPKAKSADGKKDDPAAPLEKVDNQTFNQLMDALHGEGEMAESLGGMISLMGSTPEMRETTKLMLIEALGQAGELIDLAKKASPEMKDLFEVLITERNEGVIRQLKQQVAKLRPGQSVAVFYGAAHMDEIARRLTSELHYQPAAKAWDTAFSADGKKSIMPAAQIRMLIQGMRAQMADPAAASKSGLGLPFLNLGQPPASPAAK